MSLSPTLIITPLNPDVQLNDGGLVARGTFLSLGGYTNYRRPKRLSDHYDNDRLLTYQGKNWDNTLNADSRWYYHSVYRTRINLDENYWAGDTQVLVIFDIETISGPQDIQIFVGDMLVREENIDGRENIVIVYDFVRNVDIFVRSKNFGDQLFFYKASIFII